MDDLKITIIKLLLSTIIPLLFKIAYEMHKNKSKKNNRQSTQLTAVIFITNKKED